MDNAALIGKFEQYMRSERRLSPHTCTAYLGDLSDFDRYMGGEVSFAEVKARDLRSYVMMMVERGDNPRSINRRVVALSSFYNFLRRQGVVTSNPTLMLKSLRTAQRLPEFVPDAVMDRLVERLLATQAQSGVEDSVGDNSVDYFAMRDAMVVLLLFGTGIRRAELCGLTVEDVDLGKMSIKVMGKGSKEREIPISKPLMDKLEEYLHIRNAENSCVGQKNFLFLTKKAEGLDVNGVYRVVHSVLMAAGVDGRCSPHVLRHTFATRLMGRGVGVRTIEELMGHSSLNSTQIYAHSSIEQLKECYQDCHPRARGGSK